MKKNNQMRNRMVKPLLVGVLGLMLTGCLNSPFVKHADNSVHQVNRDIDEAKYQMDKPIPPVITRSGYYVDTNPISLSKPPIWFDNQITLKGNNMPLEFYISQILENTGAVAFYDGATVKVQGGEQGKTTAFAMDKKLPLTLNFHGSKGRALDMIANKTGYAYTISDHGKLVSWSAFMDKVFNISFMAGTSEYEVGGSGASSDGGGSVGAAGSVTFGAGGSGGPGGDSSQFSKMKGSLSVWSDMEKTIKNLLSQDGRETVSESTTSVAVHDYPKNVRAIGDYVEKLNREMTRQVMIQVQVLQVTLNREFLAGINWALLGQVISEKNVFHLGLGSPNPTGLVDNVAPSSVGILSRTSAGLLETTGSGRLSGTSLFVQALEQQGKVSTVTQPRVVTMNNQVAQIAIDTETAYLQSTTTTNTATAGTSSTSLTPGVVTTGFTLYVLPKIKDDKVYMQLSSSLSLLTGIQTINQSGQTSSSDNTSGSSSTAIQIPTVDMKRFNQRSVVQSGNTLVLAGFKQVDNTVERSKLFESTQLGSRSATHNNTETILLITPVIIGPGLS